MTGDEFQVTKILATTDRFIFAEAVCISRNKEFSLNIVARAFIQGIRNIFDSNRNLQCVVAVYLPHINNDNESLEWNIVRRDMIKSWDSLSTSSVDSTIYHSVDDIVAPTYGYAVTIEHSQGEWDVVGVSLDVEGKQDVLNTGIQPSQELRNYCMFLIK